MNSEKDSKPSWKSKVIDWLGPAVLASIITGIAYGIFVAGGWYNEVVRHGEDLKTIKEKMVELGESQSRMETELTASQSRMAAEFRASQSRLENELKASQSRMEAELRASQFRLETELRASQSRLEGNMEVITRFIMKDEKGESSASLDEKGAGESVSSSLCV